MLQNSLFVLSSELCAEGILLESVSVDNAVFKGCIPATIFKE